MRFSITLVLILISIGAQGNEEKGLEQKTLFC